MNKLKFLSLFWVISVFFLTSCNDDITIDDSLDLGVKFDKVEPENGKAVFGIYHLNGIHTNAEFVAPFTVKKWSAVIYDSNGNPIDIKFTHKDEFKNDGKTGFVKEEFFTLDEAAKNGKLHKHFFVKDDTPEGEYTLEIKVYNNEDKYQSITRKFNLKKNIKFVKFEMDPEVGEEVGAIGNPHGLHTEIEFETNGESKIVKYQIKLKSVELGEYIKIKPMSDKEEEWNEIFEENFNEALINGKIHKHLLVPDNVPEGEYWIGLTLFGQEKGQENAEWRKIIIKKGTDDPHHHDHDHEHDHDHHD